MYAAKPPPKSRFIAVSLALHMRLPPPFRAGAYSLVKVAAKPQPKSRFLASLGSLRGKHRNILINLDNRIPVSTRDLEWIQLVQRHHSIQEEGETKAVDTRKGA